MNKEVRQKLLEWAERYEPLAYLADDVFFIVLVWHDVKLCLYALYDGRQVEWYHSVGIIMVYNAISFC